MHAFPTYNSRVDYCNSLLYGLPAVQLNKVQGVLNTATRILYTAPRASTILHHWDQVGSFCFIKVSEITDPTLIKHFCLTLIVWMILQSIYRPQNTLPLTFHSSENQSRVHLVSLGYQLKPPKHPCLPSTLFSRVGLILLQRTFLSLPLIQMSTEGQLNPGPVDAHSPHTISLSNKGLRVCHWNIRSFRTTN